MFQTKLSNCLFGTYKRVHNTQSATRSKKTTTNCNGKKQKQTEEGYTRNKEERGQLRSLLKSMASQAQPPPPSTGLSTGGIVAISIVLGVGFVLVLAGLLWMRRRKRRSQAAAAGGLEAAKPKHHRHHHQQQPSPANSASNPAELAGGGGGGDQDLRPPLPPRPHRDDSPQAPPSPGYYATVERHDDAGGSGADPRQQQQQQTPTPVSGPVEMQAEDWPRPSGVTLPPPPEQESIPRELPATRPQQDRAPPER